MDRWPSAVSRWTNQRIFMFRCQNSQTLRLGWWFLDSWRPYGSLHLAIQEGTLKKTVQVRTWHTIIFIPRILRVVELFQPFNSMTWILDTSNLPPLFFVFTKFDDKNHHFPLSKIRAESVDSESARFGVFMTPKGQQNGQFLATDDPA